MAADPRCGRRTAVGLTLTSETLSLPLRDPFRIPLAQGTIDVARLAEAAALHAAPHHLDAGAVVHHADRPVLVARSVERAEKNRLGRLAV